MNDPGGLRVRVRRRTRQHRRNRLFRRVLLAAVFVLGGLTGAALLPIDFSSYLASSFSSHPAAEWKATDIRDDLALSAAETDFPLAPAKADRPVYPYSLVPGGVHDPKELEQVFDHDPVVAAHYRGFDFHHARVVELGEDRTVYVSYRIASNVYWTTKRVLLRRGERVITDGKMTLRTRCGNQVSESARPDVSPKEPPIARMEEPVNDGGSGNMVPFPVNFDRSRPNFPSFAPSAPGYRMIVNNGGLLSLYPPPLPTCSPGKTGKKGNGSTGARANDKKKDDGGCSSPPAQVPEPSSLVLLSSGIVGAYLRYRRKS